MKKYFLLFLALFFSVSNGFCKLSETNVNLLNLKENNIYILTVPSKVLEYNVVNEKSVNVSTMTTLANEKRMLLIEAKQGGVSDVSIRTEENLYQVRFVVGPDFQDESDDLIMIDLPATLIGGK
ncbi:MAG: hypothetical protein IJY61_04855 [Candidatus Gastranaerophilales bacterium]|nr:hypothetical protein [Candidatus Gastranaerophilales bacterium]